MNDEELQREDHINELNECIDQLEKALDKACELLEEYGALTNLYSEDKRTSKEWKEWCLKDE